MKLTVSEIFNSIQGEGPHVGVPATFVRFAGCDLNCSFCDSKYALKTSLAMDYSVDELVTVVVSYAFYGGTVILTGGEPSIQDCKLMTTFVQQLRQVATATGKGTLSVHVETNGNQFCDWMMDCDCIVVSPKTLIDFDFFETMCIRNAVSVYLKFVVTVNNKVDTSIQVSLLNAANEWLDWSLPYILDRWRLHSLCEVFISPMAPIPFSLDTYLYRVKQLGDLFSDVSVISSLPYKRVRLTLQLHKLIWGDVKGK